MDWALILGLVNTVAIGIIGYFTIKYAKPQSDLNRKQLEQIEAEEEAATRAQVDVSYFRGQPDKFVITNEGHATAQKVEFVILGDKKPYSDTEHRSRFPCPALEAGESIVLVAMTSMASPSFWECTVSWKDPDGKPQKREKRVYRS